MQYLAKVGDQQRFTNVPDGRPWENGRWYFVVANWSWPKMSLSLDAAPFVT